LRYYEIYPNLNLFHAAMMIYNIFV